MPDLGKRLDGSMYAIWIEELKVGSLYTYI